jgi:hypothetical protein
MRCETCDKEFPDSAVKVWSGKKVCPACFQTLNDAQSGQRSSQPADLHQTIGDKARALADEVVPTSLANPGAHGAFRGVAEAVMTAAEDLGISLSREQVLRILANNNFPEYTKVATPLTPEERAVAVEVKYRWYKNMLGAKHSDATIREIAAQQVEAAEIGRATGAGQLAHKLGCAVVLALVSACSMTIAAVLVAVMIVRGF